MLRLTMAMANVLAANIRTLRLARGENQTEFADALGVNQGTVARWEGGAQPKHEPLIKMAHLAGCTVGEFTSQLISNRYEGAALKEGAPISTISMPVIFPNEQSLVDMFETLLAVTKKERDPSVIARRLAQLLPSAIVRAVSQQLSVPFPVDDKEEAGEGVLTQHEANPAHREPPST